MADPMMAGSLEELESEWIGNPSPTVCARLADLLRQTGRFEEASQLAATGLRRWPGTVTIGIVLGRSLREAGKLEAAVEAFETVLAAQPMNLVALRGLGEISFRKRKWRKAIGHLEEYLLEHPADQEALEMLQQARRSDETPDPLAEDDEEEPVQEHEDSEPAGDGDEGVPVPSFPDTERMARVLEAQGIPGPVRPVAPDVPLSPEETVSLPLDPASLLDLFSEEEREELGLSSFDGELI